MTRWYGLDLPKTIAVRRRFLPETDKVTMIARSAMDLSWMKRITPCQRTRMLEKSVRVLK